MNIRETKTYSMSFSKEEATLIDSLVREQVGKRTINSILDEYSYVINYYGALFTLVQKVYNVGSYNSFSSDEIRVLTDILAKAYNDGKHDASKEMIKEICDAIDLLRH